MLARSLAKLLVLLQPEILAVFKLGGLAPNLPTIQKYWRNLKFGDGVSGPFIRPSPAEVLEQSHEFANLQEIKLAVC